MKLDYEFVIFFFDFFTCTCKSILHTLFKQVVYVCIDVL